MTDKYRRTNSLSEYTLKQWTRNSFSLLQKFKNLLPHSNIAIFLSVFHIPWLSGLNPLATCASKRRHFPFWWDPVTTDATVACSHQNQTYLTRRLPVEECKKVKLYRLADSQQNTILPIKAPWALPVFSSYFTTYLTRHPSTLAFFPLLLCPPLLQHFWPKKDEKLEKMRVSKINSLAYLINQSHCVIKLTRRSVYGGSLKAGGDEENLGAGRLQNTDGLMGDWLTFLDLLTKLQV